MTTRRRGRQIDPYVQYEIEEKTGLGWTPKQIHRWFEEQVIDKRLPESKLPGERTLQRVAEEATMRDTSGPWRIADADDPEDAKLILDVLANVTVHSTGKKHSFTKEEARWVLRVRKIVPDADPVKVWFVARAYQLYQSRGLDSRALDMYLAFAPWRGVPHMRLYLDAVDWVKESWIPWREYFNDVPGAEWRRPMSYFDRISYLDYLRGTKGVKDKLAQWEQILGEEGKVAARKALENYLRTRAEEQAILGSAEETPPEKRGRGRKGGKV